MEQKHEKYNFTPFNLKMLIKPREKIILPLLGCHWEGQKH